MPTYEYECSGCNRTFEVEQKMSDPPIQNCPLPSARTVDAPPCGAPVQRLISGSTSFVLKGPRWAKDGY